MASFLLFGVLNLKHLMKTSNSWQVFTCHADLYESTLGIFVMQKMSHHTSSHQEILAFLWWNTLISIILNETLRCPTAIILQTPSFRICPSLGNQLANRPINQSKSTNQPTTRHHFSPVAADSAAFDHSLMVPLVPMERAIQSQIPRSQKGSIQKVKNRKAKSPQFHEWAKTEPYIFLSYQFAICFFF